MTLRYMQLMTVTVGIGALIACSGDDPTTTKTDNTDNTDNTDSTDNTDDDPPVDTVDTSDVGGGFFDATDLYMAAYFTYDAVNQVPVTGNTDYGPIDPGYEITMALASWNQDPANTADYCFVVLPLLSATPRPEAFQDARLWYGIDYNPADGAFTNCGEVGYEMDPKIWGPNVGDLWLYYADNYFISVGEMTQAVNDAIAASDPTLIPLAVGGQIGVAGFLSSDIPGIVDDVYGFVNPIDPAFNIDFANNVLAVDVNQGTNIAPGFYNMNSLVYWSLSL